MARKCLEGFLGDEVRDLDINGPMLVRWDGCEWDDNAVFVIVSEGGRIEGSFVLVAALRWGCGNMWV